jgi:hypothetical protein
VEDEEQQSEQGEKYGLKLWVNRGEALVYMEEHWFVDRPTRAAAVL